MRENEKEIVRKAGKKLLKLIALIVIYIFLNAFINTFLPSILRETSIDFERIYMNYQSYINVIIALAVGYLIIKSFTSFIYWNLRIKYDHPTAQAVKNVFKILGIGVLISTIAGSISGGTAGVALGGFIGMVIGFATQKILGQAIAGLFILITRPFKISDLISIGGDEGIVEDVSIMFTIIKKSDGTTVLIPNNTLIGGKIYIKRRAAETK